MMQITPTTNTVDTTVDTKAWTFSKVATCQGDHYYFVAESFASEKDGSIGVVLVCTRCGEGLVKKFDIGQGTSVIETIKKEK